MKKLLFILMALIFSTILLGQRPLSFVEKFDAHTEVPGGWHTSVFVIREGQGVGGSKALSALSTTSSGAPRAVSPLIGPILPGSVLRFDYQFTLNSGGEFPGPAATFSPCTEFNISAGDVRVRGINSTNHVVSQEYRTITCSLDQVVGQTVSIEFFMIHTDNTFLNIDNVYVYVPLHNDLYAMSISGPVLPTIDTESVYSVEVMNLSPQSVSDYFILLMLQDGESSIEIASVDGISIPSMGSHVFQMPWIPTASGVHNIYGRIVYGSDQYTQNDKTDILSIVAITDVTTIDYIGNPASTFRSNLLPFSFNWNSNVAQSIYLEDEIQAGSGYITHIGYMFRGLGDIKPDYPVSVYIAHTDISVFPSRTAWIDPAEFTKVFEGFIRVGNDGFYDVFIELDTPFLYGGGNIAVMTHKHFTESYQAHDSRNAFLTTSTQRFDRTLKKNQNTEIDLNDLGIGDALSQFPNIKFFMSDPSLGALSGIVTHEDIPLDGVKIVVHGTNREAITAIDGRYFISGIPASLISITASKQGYSDTMIEDIIIIADENFTQDISMNVLIPNPPRNVIAIDNKTKVDISYEEPYFDSTTQSYAIPHSYNIYMTLDDSKENEASWTNIATNHQGYDFTYDAWGDLPTGDYVFVVRAVYSEKDISEPAFSNVCRKTTSEDKNDMPYLATGLRGNFPNPFNPVTTISFDVGTDAFMLSTSSQGDTHIRIDIFNVRGQKIKNLVNETYAPGSYTVEWNGTADDGSHVGSGMYFYRMITEETTATRKMVLMK